MCIWLEYIEFWIGAIVVYLAKWLTVLRPHIVRKTEDVIID